MTDILTLIGDGIETTIFCGKRSIGMREFYEASARDFYPELVFILADYLEYHGEQLLRHEGQTYRVLRTYRTGQELELTVVRASAEEGGIYG